MKCAECNVEIACYHCPCGMYVCGTCQLDHVHPGHTLHVDNRIMGAFCTDQHDLLQFACGLNDTAALSTFMTKTQTQYLIELLLRTYRLQFGEDCAIHRPPLKLRITCPDCGELHIDEGEFETKPHHTHACQACGCVWRPAVENTVGVRFLPGFKQQEKP